MPKRNIFLTLAIVLLGLSIAMLRRPQSAAADSSPLHPRIVLKDADGASVLASGAPISTLQTCGTCHDTAFIQQHSFHADLGLGDAPPADAPHAWDSGSGPFGRWDPLTYRYLSPAGDARVDLTTAEWVATFARHVGGGPAVQTADGTPLTALAPGGALPAQVVDAAGNLQAWEWQASGTVEMNCFLCHSGGSNNAARLATLAAGQFGWANSATLLGSGVITQTAAGYAYNPTAFAADGSVDPALLQIQDPANANCAQCHGAAHSDARQPLVIDGCAPDDWSTYTTGQVFAPQRVSDSGLNVTGKATTARSFDIHAERVVACVDCHYALNNPVSYQEANAERPDHLLFDPRRIDFGEFLYRPLHDFAKGSSAQSALAPELDNTLRRCESCHATESTHSWLPYADAHMATLACETCHIPNLYAPALTSIDWTVLTSDGTPRSECRGIEGDPAVPPALITGYTPVLLNQTDADGQQRLAPHNLISSWYWIYGDPARPVPQRDLRAVWLDGDGYAPDIVAAFDADGDGALDDDELRLDSDARTALIAARLTARGLANPRIVGEVQPYSINHNVAAGEWALRDCQACHTADSRVAQALPLADYLPGGVQPTLLGGSGVDLAGTLVSNPQGTLFYVPTASAAERYVLGHDRVNWIDWLGALLFVGTLAGVFVHGGLRFYMTRRNPPHAPALRRVYMYTVYERLWHWLQTAAILLLIFTGLVIHRPDQFAIFSFRYVVLVHNALAAVVVVNAALALFYHLASGEIRQFLPRPYGFFDQAIVQAKYYLGGIFRNAPHPFEKTVERKLNPLQQVTYLAILNVLLPLQIITGTLMWGAQRWPAVAQRFGGLPYLAPFHTLVAWSFAAFVVLHVYLTTTGHTPLAGIKAMMIGWDEVEAAAAEAAAAEDAAAEAGTDAAAQPAD